MVPRRGGAVSFESDLEASIPVLNAYARRMTGGRPEAEDLVQETIARALAGRRGFDGANMTGWLLTILKNHFLNELRKKSLRRKRRDQVAASSCGVWTAQVPPAPDSRWVGQDAVEAVDRLIPEYRDVVLAVEVEGLRYREAAARLGCPIGTVMSRLHRARTAFARAAL